MKWEGIPNGVAWGDTVQARVPLQEPWVGPPNSDGICRKENRDLTDGVNACILSMTISS